MSQLLRLSGAIDRLNTVVGRAVTWLVLVMTLISSGNAVIRYAFNASSNAWLEIQWYLFSAVFLLCAGYTLLNNEHIRIDIIAGRFSRRTQTWIEVIGGVFFLLPMASLILWLSWPIFVGSLQSGEMSSDAGGLIRWPAKLLIPVGFALLTLQGLSETIKRIAFLLGMTPDPAAHAGGSHGGGHD
ncbi:MAG: TRAP transporter small permease subunit [Magnetospirillum sp.]|nr:TRAP transporter small permease subunit [Magnetospirillum sp.]